MLSVYLFAALAGGLLVGVSLLGGGHHDDSAGSLTAGADDGNAAELVGSGRGGEAELSGGGGRRRGGGLAALLRLLFSLQLWTYLLAFGGLTGLLLHWLAALAEPLAGGLALTVGLGTALAARKVLRQLTATGDSGTVQTSRLIGSSAVVLLPAAAGATGKVRLSARGQTVDLLAKAHDGGALVAGAEVVIVELSDDLAEVASVFPDSPAPLPAAVARPAATPISGSRPQDKG